MFKITEVIRVSNLNKTKKRYHSSRKKYKKNAFDFMFYESVQNFSYLE